jgi:hypothetical protein
VLAKAIKQLAASVLGFALRVDDAPSVKAEIDLAVDCYTDGIEVKRGAVSDYRMWFDFWLGRVRSGGITPDDFNGKHRQVIQFLAEQAYTDGMLRGGVDAPLDADDVMTVNIWVSGQLRHTWGLAEALGEALQTGDWNAVNVRRQMWLDAMAELEGRGFASAQGNMMVTWRLGQTEEHCATCNRLNGQRHRLKWFVSRGYIPQQNASETLECGGWRCQCGLYDDKGNRVLPA